MSSSPPVGSRAGWGRSRISEGAPASHLGRQVSVADGEDLHQREPRPQGAAAAAPPSAAANNGVPRGTKALGAEADTEEVARAIALRQLTSSARSRAQLAEAMAKKDIPDEVAARVLDRFVEVGLIDDAEYAAMLVRTRHAERGLARRALAQELNRKGIDQETAALALAQIGPEDEHAAALDLVRRRAGATRGKPVDLRTRRLVAMLARKGHPPGLAFTIVAQVLAEEGVDVSHQYGIRE